MFVLEMGQTRKLGEKHENNGTELLSHLAVDEARVGEERDNPVFQRVAKGPSAWKAGGVSLKEPLQQIE